MAFKFIPPRCSWDGCDRPVRTRGYCAMHYNKLWSSGELPLLPPLPPLEERFRARIHYTETCWEWTGSINNRGYGTFHDQTKANRYAHRLAYEWWRGPIPKGLCIDHLCRNHRCVNPDHLEAVTDAENKRRGRIARGLLLVTAEGEMGRCGRGHLLDAENGYPRPDGSAIQCRACRRLRDQAPRQVAS